MNANDPHTLAQLAQEAAGSLQSVLSASDVAADVVVLIHRPDAGVTIGASTLATAQRQAVATIKHTLESAYEVVIHEEPDYASERIVQHRPGEET